MTNYAASISAVVVAVRAALVVLQTYLGLGAYICPPSTDVATVVANGIYDYIIVGGGTAGSALAYELRKTCPNTTILMLEEGGTPPFEAQFPGLFTLLPLSDYDRGMNPINDNYTHQNLKSKYITAAKMLGGTSSLDHMVQASVFPHDYKSWGVAANDTTWSFPEFAKYFSDEENDTRILSQQKSSTMSSIIDALSEIGYTYKDKAAGLFDVIFPSLGIGNKFNKIRQSSVESYLSKLIDDKQFTLITGATVTKVNFDGTTATGVQFNVSGSSYSINASKEVILSAGAFGSPHLLMLSGVGPAAVLTENQITVVADNEHVGQHLQDRNGAMVAYTMQNSTETTPPMNPYLFPVDLVVAYGGSSNGSDNVNLVIRFPPSSSAFLQLCGIGFKYIDDICNAIYEYNTVKEIMAVIMYVKSKSEGYVTLNSTNPTGAPSIALNQFSNSTDLDTFAQRAMELSEIRNTTVFQGFESELIDVGVCSNLTKYSEEYWRCYVIEMSTPSYSWCGTCGLGKVVDSELRVFGVSNLRVVDASVFHSVPTGLNTNTVLAVAKKAAEAIGKECTQC